MKQFHPVSLSEENAEFAEGGGEERGGKAGGGGERGKEGGHAEDERTGERQKAGKGAELIED